MLKSVKETVLISIHAPNVFGCPKILVKGVNSAMIRMLHLELVNIRSIRLFCPIFVNFV